MWRRWVGCIAPDLIGMGGSAKLPGSGPGSYRYVQHRRYLDELLQLLDVRERVTLVGHDWGSALAFDWAVRQPDSVKGLAYMEAIVTPLTWDDWPAAARRVFRGMRSEAGEEIILDKNVFIERILPASILRNLTPYEMEEYRRPFRHPGEDRRPTLTWPREIPIDGAPPDVHSIVEDYSARLAAWDVPKLFVNADPGRDPGGACPRGMPVLAQPDGDHGSRYSLRPRRFARPDRYGPGGLAGCPVSGDRCPVTDIPFSGRRRYRIL